MINENIMINETLQKKESLKNTATFLMSETKGKEVSVVKSEKKVSLFSKETFAAFSKTSTPVPDKMQKTIFFDDNSNEKKAEHSEEMDFGVESTPKVLLSKIIKTKNSNLIENISGNIKNKKKLKKEKKENCKENIDEVAPTVRITRTKSKALQQMMDKSDVKTQNDLSLFAKKLINKAKKNSLKKNQITAITEKNYIIPNKLSNMLLNSKLKFHLLLSNSKKIKTPLATLPNSSIKINKASNKDSQKKMKIARRNSSAENLDQRKEEKLKSKQKKEEAAAKNRQNVIKSKQEELKRKNEHKHQLAMKQREKLEQKKYKNMIQLEKEKEERHKLILQERQMKLKEEAFKKKMLMQQKIAETNERRRLEEEARITKLKEMAEEEKKKEMLEKRAKERLAQKKAREEYELQLKKELEVKKMKAEKSAKKKLCQQSASKPQPNKRQTFEFFNDKKEEWDYKPRNENDYGFSSNLLGIISGVFGAFRNDSFKQRKP